MAIFRPRGLNQVGKEQAGPRCLTQEVPRPVARLGPRCLLPGHSTAERILGDTPLPVDRRWIPGIPRTGRALNGIPLPIDHGGVSDMPRPVGISEFILLTSSSV